MPFCIKCSTENSAGTKYCSKCGAVLPQMAPTGVPDASGFEVDENTTYITPNFHYPADELLNLAWAANDFLEEGSELDPFLDAYEIVKEKFTQHLETTKAEMQELIADARTRDPNDAHPKQLAYLNNKGTAYLEEGLASVEAFLAALDEDKILTDRLKDGVVKLVMANDHFCLIVALIQVRVNALLETLEASGITQGADGELVAGPIPKAPLRPVAKPAATSTEEEEHEPEEEDEE